LEITSSGLRFKICLVELEKLKPHEEVSDNIADELAAEMLAKNEVRDPLMVDEKTLVILDGMHRYAALKKIDCAYALCCLFNYDDPRIKVGSWYRFLNVDDGDAVAEKKLAELRLKYKRHSRIDEKDFHHPTIITKLYVYQTEDNDSIRSARLALQIEKSLIRDGYDIQYAPENTIEEHLSNTSNIALPIPIFTKTMIRQIPSTGRLLPHKVTRHLIPSRPLRLNVPLTFLQDRVGIDEANKKLDAHLSLRRIERKPPGSMVDGRRYQEELLIFSNQE
jgi:hypothetical protein